VIAVVAAVEKPTIRSLTSGVYFYRSDLPYNFGKRISPIPLMLQQFPRRCSGAARMLCNLLLLACSESFVASS